MKRALILIGILAAALLVALVLRVRHLRAAEHGPAGGSGVIEGVDVNATSRIAARITKVNVREGDIVKKGDVLVELDCTEQEASFNQAKAELAAAQSNLQGRRPMRPRRHRTRRAGRRTSTWRSRRSRFSRRKRSSRASISRERRAREERSAAAGGARRGAFEGPGAAEPDRRAARLESMVKNQAGALRATGTGRSRRLPPRRTTSRPRRRPSPGADLGGRVQAACAARRDGRVAQPRARRSRPGGHQRPRDDRRHRGRTRFYLPNSELAAAAPGRKVRVVADAYPGQTFEGTIFYVSPRAEFTPRNVQTREDRERLVYAVEVRIPNADMRLRSGMPVDVSIEGSWQ
jgi:HlyD family secretion protein